MMFIAACLSVADAFQSCFFFFARVFFDFHYQRHIAAAADFFA